MLPLVTIIVPVYNVSRYLPACIQGILQQTYPNIEVILVDDGSTDESGSICDQLGARHDSIFVEHQDNQGLSAARNRGIALAHGEFLVFVDSDDLVSSAYVEALYLAMKSSGCFMSTLSKGETFVDGTSPELAQNIDEVSHYQVVSEVEYQSDLLYQKSQDGAQWRMYRAECLTDSFFPVGFEYEGLATTYKYVHGRGSVAVLESRNLYGYRLRSGSLMRSEVSNKKIKACRLVTQELYSNINHWYPELSKAVESRCFSVNRSAYSAISNINVEGRSQIWNELTKYRKTVLWDKDARKRERTAALFACLGQNMFALFCKAYLWYKRKH
jgi:glycosyltransferase involved in cell wall biosynthesis